MRTVNVPITRRGLTCRGLTLVETMISMALMSLAVTTVYSLFSMFLANSRAISAQAELEGSAHAAMARMTADLADSKATTISLGTAPVGVVLLSPRDGNDRLQRDDAGNLLWQRWVCYYLDAGSHTLVRATIPLAAATISPPPNPYTTSSFLSQGTRRVVARGISSMLLTGSNPINLTATFVTSVSTANDLQVTLTDAVKPRN